MKNEQKKEFSGKKQRETIGKAEGMGGSMRPLPVAINSIHRRKAKRQLPSYHPIRAREASVSASLVLLVTRIGEYTFQPRSLRSIAESASPVRISV